MTSEFTPEEERLLKPFVSTTEGNIFVLTNLPEVIKGALFSRYSRTIKSVKRLLIDEFITNKESGLDRNRGEKLTANSSQESSTAVSQKSTQDNQEEALRIKKAQDFYDRILDGYGDDSIGELGGAHVAIEGISNMATKVIQDSRIGGSPLEKSSRYVWFNKKKDGEYQFYKDPDIMNSEFKDEYIKLMNLLFDTYSELVEPMENYFKEQIPQEEGTPDQAYNFSIRAKACDALRGLLPVATKTNMGVFGNGRFFEYLILKLRNQPLKEMHEIADKLQEELDKVMPSFVRRCKPENKHFPPAEDFYGEAEKTASAFGKQLTAIQTRQTENEVELIDYDPNGEEKVIATLIYEQTNKPLKQLREIAQKLSHEEKEQLLDKYFAKRTNRRHKPPRAFENVYYTYDLLVDFGNYRDLHRHRTLTQERQRISTDHGHITPKEVVAAGFEEKWMNCMNKAKELHDKIHKKLPRQAQYVVPFAYKIRWYVTINARSLFWMTELRSTAHGHSIYRRIAQKMYMYAKNAHPLLFKHCKYVDMNTYELGRLESEKKIALKGIVKNE